MPAAATAWFTAAGVTRLDASFALLGAVVLATLALCSALGCLASGTVRRVAVLCVVPLAIATLVCAPASASLAARTAGPVSTAVQEQSTVTAVVHATSDATMISSDRFTGSSRFLVEGTLTAGTLDGVRFTARTPVVVIGPETWQSVASSDSVRTAGRLLPTKPGDRAAALLIAATSPHVTSPAGWTTVPAELRSDFSQLSSRLTGEGGLLPGMVIGDRSTLDENLEADMQTTGMTHLTAVSGANCSYLLAFVFLGARALRLPRLPSAVLGILALIGFVILVRPEPSVLRAALMGGIGVAAVLSGRGKVPLALLLLTVVVLLTIDPWLHASFAFMLSVAAAAGLILFGPVLASRLSRFMPLLIAQLVAVPVAAQLFCAPILTLLQPGLALYSVPANIAASPVVPIVTIVGMAAVALIAVAEPLAVPLVLVAGSGTAWVGAVATFFSSAPGATLPWLGGPAGVILTGILSATIVAAVMFGPRRRTLLRGAGGSVTPNPLPGHHRSKAPSGQRRIGALLWLAVGCAAGLAAVALWPPGRHDSGMWHIASCDVGQGDAFAVRTGERSVILIDTGPEPDAVDACLDRLAVDTVELLVLTHLHADHYGGIEGVPRDRTVKRILYSSSEPALPATVTGAAAQQTPPERLSAGMTGEHGDGGSYGRVSWTVLWPEAGAPADSENNSSAVLDVVIETDSAPAVAILLTGDLEEDAARALLSASPGLGERGIQILKVAHHGARNGGLDLAHSLKPRLAMISAGRDNDYGHPHPTITAGLAAAGITVARTDELGTFLVSIEDNSLRVHR
ncbi:ComEC/Rec2 family competence protein [Arthrobacter flavus]|uniref:ComEC/Rec2 family competence protein n=1 Tax=Arthrobacter flavus TaxID=95172 RepID=A0ABW4QC78_9MICC